MIARMAPSVVVLGAMNMDLVATASRFPSPGETVAGQTFYTSPGGKGANQSVAAARLGARVRFIGRVGRDDFGAELVRSLQSHGVDTSAVATDEEAPSGVAHIQVDSTGQNKIIIVPGANGRCGEPELGRLRQALPETDALLLQLELPVELSLAVAQEAHRHGCRVIFDPAPAGPFPPESFSHLDALLPNESEAEALVGFPVQDPDSARRAAHALHKRGVPAVVIKLGAQGAYYATAEGEGMVPAFEVAVVDTVAAGDAFNAAFAVALVEGQRVAEAVRWGVAAGAVAVTRPGAQASMPIRQEVMALLQAGAR